MKRFDKIRLNLCLLKYDVEIPFTQQPIYIAKKYGNIYNL